MSGFKTKANSATKLSLEYTRSDIDELRLADCVTTRFAVSYIADTVNKQSYNIGS